MDNTSLTKHVFYGITLNVKTIGHMKLTSVFVDIDTIFAFQSCSLVSFENPRHFLQEIKLNLLDKYKHQWKTILNLKVNFHYCSHIKRELSLELYVSMI